MNILLHDLSENDFKAFFGNVPENALVVSPADGEIRPCSGCFGCWIKTPGVCVIKDGYQFFGANLAGASRFTVISEICYGGYSPFVKNVIDRSIACFLPFFMIKDGKMRHTARKGRVSSFRVLAYGSAEPEEFKAFERLAALNAMNLGTKDHSFKAVKAPTELKPEEIFQ